MLLYRVDYSIVCLNKSREMRHSVVVLSCRIHCMLVARVYLMSVDIFIHLLIDVSSSQLHLSYECEQGERKKTVDTPDLLAQ